MLSHPSPAYSSDAVYLYSTKDDPQPTSIATRDTALLPSNSINHKHDQSAGQPSGLDSMSHPAWSDRDALMDGDIERLQTETEATTDSEELDIRDHSDDSDAEEDDEATSEATGDERYSGVPIIMPRSRFAGACNVETVKDGACSKQVALTCV